MKKKKCSQCDKIKSLDEFNWKNKSKSMRRAECKECNNKRGEKWRKENPEGARTHSKKQYEKNKNKSEYKTKARACAAKRREENPNCGKEWFERHPGYISPCRIENPDYFQNWCEEHRQELSAYHKKRMQNKRTNPVFRLNASMSSGMNKSLKGNKKGPWLNTVSYTLQMFKERLNEQMQELSEDYPEKIPMSLENYGIVWEIHHIIAISHWKFETPEDREFKQCWALCNLQPLWKKDNRSKGNRT